MFQVSKGLSTWKTNSLLIKDLYVNHVRVDEFRGDPLFKNIARKYINKRNEKTAVHIACDLCVTDVTKHPPNYFAYKIKYHVYNHLSI